MIAVISLCTLCTFIKQHFTGYPKVVALNSDNVRVIMSDNHFECRFRPLLHDIGATPIRYKTGVKPYRCVIFDLRFARYGFDITSRRKDNSYDVT